MAAKINTKKPTCSNILRDLLPLNEAGHKYRYIGKKIVGLSTYWLSKCKKVYIIEIFYQIS